MINRVLLIACFASGAAGLMYEILWARSFALILGSTTQAAALTFAAFLSGLAIGAWLFGRLSDRLHQPLRAFALLEAGIALTAVTVGLLLHRNADIIGAFLGAGLSQLPLLFLVALVLILPPTVLMGGTLPIILTAARRQDSSPSIVGRFYGLNTLGAAVGTLACGFLTIRLLGVSNSFYVAMALNLFAGALSLALSSQSAAQDGDTGTKETDVEQQKAPGEESAAETYLLLIAVASGAVVLSLEVVWTRFAAFFLGNRSFAFATLMFAVLTLLALASRWSAYLVSRTPPAQLYARFTSLLLWSSLAVSLSAACAWWLIEHQTGFEQRLGGLDEWLLLYRFAEAFLLLAAPLLLLGTLFPLALASSRHAASTIGSASGRYYAFNAVGIVVGSLGTGFIGLELIGSFGMIKLLSAVLLALALYTVIGRLQKAPRGAVALGSTALIATLLLPSDYPPQLEEGESIVLSREDKHGLFRLIERPNGRLAVSNNRTELVFHLGSYATSRVQQLQGHLGVHFNPDARRALVIGSGYGITAGALALYDTMEQVDAVEILPAMVEAADLFEPHNFSYHKRDNVNVHIGDGRHFMLQQTEPYDIISVNVSDPHLPGGASTFHYDFYELAKRHLAPGGVLIQHAFGSELEIIANTLAASFPYTAFSRSYGNGYNVIGSMEPLDEHMRQRLSIPGQAWELLVQTNRGRPFRQRPFLSFDQVKGIERNDLIATDDFPRIEYAWKTGSKILFINE